MRVGHQAHAVAGLLHVGPLQHQRQAFVQAAQFAAQHRGQVAHPQGAHFGVVLAGGQQLAQHPHVHRGAQRVLLGVHGVQADERAHARVQHGQGLLHLGQQVLQQLGGFDRLGDRVVVHQGEQLGVGEQRQAGGVAFVVPGAQRGLQALREAGPPGVAVLEQREPGPRRAVPGGHFAHLLLLVLQGRDGHVDATTQHGGRVADGFLEALLQQRRGNGHGGKGARGAATIM